MPSIGWYKKLGLVASNQLLVEACVFLRNIIIARLIGAETLGEFIFLILSIRLFAMSTDLAVERFIMQTVQSSVTAAMAGAHYIIRIRSSLLSVILLIMGLFNIQGISFTCFSLLAFGSLMRGFTHQGYRLKQRDFNFKPALYVEAFSAAIATVTMYLVALHVPTLEAMCAVMAAQACVHTALSYLFSGGKYWAKAPFSMLKIQVKFGLPLMFSGMAMFWSMQGERVILSAVLPATEFAHFSMMFQLALVPVLVAARMALTIGLPVLAKAKKTPAQFNKNLDQFQLYLAGFSVLFFIGFIAVANPLLTALFGPDFQMAFTLILLVGTAQAIRLCRTPHSVAAQAQGQTDIPFKANLVRVAAVPLALLGISLGGSLALLLATACIGEALAWIVQRRLYRARNSCRATQPTQLSQQRIPQ